MAKLRGITDFALFVESVERSLAFYTDVLGFEVKRRDTGFAELATGGLTLALWERTDAETNIDLPRGNHGAPAAMVAVRLDTPAEVNDLAATLTEKGVQCFSGPRNYGWNAYAAYFSDPDGHVWEVYAWVDEPRTIAD